MVKVIILKLSRDQARSVDTLYTYWDLLCTSKMEHPGYIRIEKLQWQLFKSILYQIHCKFEKRLNGTANKFKFNFSEAEAITLNEFLMKHPIDSTEIWLINLRQYIVDRLTVQI